MRWDIDCGAEAGSLRHLVSHDAPGGGWRNDRGRSAAALLVRLGGGRDGTGCAPGRRSDAADESAARRDELQAAPDMPIGARTEHGPDALPARILVVDDHPINQRVAVRLLTHLGFTADVVSNGLEAIRSIQTEVYAAVLMDCQMPELDGYDATRAVRRWEAEQAHGGVRRRLPIIALTASVTEGDRVRCFEAGMDDFIAKPVTRSDLEITLARWLPGPTGSPDVRNRL